MGHLVVVRGGRRGWEWYPHKGTEGIRFDPQREELIFSSRHHFIELIIHRWVNE